MSDSEAQLMDVYSATWKTTTTGKRGTMKTARTLVTVALGLAILGVAPVGASAGSSEPTGIHVYLDPALNGILAHESGAFLTDPETGYPGTLADALETVRVLLGEHTSDGIAVVDTGGIAQIKVEIVGRAQAIMYDMSGDSLLSLVIGESVEAGKTSCLLWARLGIREASSDADWQWTQIYGRSRGSEKDRFAWDPTRREVCEQAGWEQTIESLVDNIVWAVNQIRRGIPLEQVFEQMMEEVKK